MANWSTLKAAIASIIKTNGNKEITGQLLQNVLNNIVSSVGENSTLAGIATPATNPGVPDGNVFYLATEAGIYSNFNGIEITSGEAVILEWRGSWSKKTSGFATKKQLTECEYPYINISDNVTISRGTSNNGISIQKSLYSKGKIKFTIDKSNFPENINYNGCQIIDSKNIEITTNGSDSFVIDAFDSDGYFRVSFYFAGAVQSDVVIPFTIKVLYGSPYDEETRNTVISNKEKTDKFIPSYSEPIYQYKLINMYVGSTGVWQRHVGKGKSILIPTDNIKTLYIIGNSTLNSSYAQLIADLNIKSGQNANITPSTEFTNLELGEYKVVEIAQDTKYVSIIINDGNGNDRKPYYIGAEFIENENSIDYKELTDYSDYDETIQGALIASTYWWQNDDTTACEVVKINVEGYNKIRVLNNRGSVTISGAILKDNATQTNNAPLPFASGITERFLFTDTILHDIELPYDSKYLYVNAKIVGGDIVIPDIQLIKDQATTINRLNNLEKEIKPIQYFNIGKETITQRFENFGNFEIIGISSILSIIKDSSGDYDTPPIEISGGLITNLSVIEDGGTTEKPAYCVHSDRDNNIDNKIVVDNCIFDSNSNACWGVGTRKNYEMIFRNCVFIQRATVDNPAISGDTHAWYSHNTSVDEVLTKEQKSKVRFWQCIFISETGEPMYIQDWSDSDSDGGMDFCEFEFIGCKFAWQGNTDDAVKIDYKGGSPELNSKEFKRHLMLSNKSTGNNVSWLNV